MSFVGVDFAPNSGDPMCEVLQLFGFVQYFLENFKSHVQRQRHFALLLFHAAAIAGSFVDFPVKTDEKKKHRLFFCLHFNCLLESGAVGESFTTGFQIKGISTPRKTER